MKVKCFLVCLGVTIDRDSGVASLYSVIDSITGKGLPIIMPELNLYANVMRESGEGDKNVVTVKAAIGDNVILDTPINVDFGGKDKTKITVKLQGFPITTIGNLQFDLLDSAGNVISGYDVMIQSAEPKYVVSEVTG